MLSVCPHPFEKVRHFEILGQRSRKYFSKTSILKASSGAWVPSGTPPRAYAHAHTLMAQVRVSKSGGVIEEKT